MISEYPLEHRRCDQPEYEPFCQRASRKRKPVLQCPKKEVSKRISTEPSGDEGTRRQQTNRQPSQRFRVRPRAASAGCGAPTTRERRDHGLKYLRACTNGPVSASLGLK